MLSDHGIGIWDAGHPDTLPTLVVGASGQVIAMTADGAWLATQGAYSDNIVVYALQNPQAPPAQLIAAHSYPPTLAFRRALAFSPDGHWLAVGTSQRGVQIWDSSEWAGLAPADR
jgi:WD40 repeat protein